MVVARKQKVGHKATSANPWGNDARTLHTVMAKETAEYVNTFMCFVSVYSWWWCTLVLVSVLLWSGVLMSVASEWADVVVFLFASRPC